MRESAITVTKQLVTAVVLVAMLATGCTSTSDPLAAPPGGATTAPVPTLDTSSIARATPAATAVPTATATPVPPPPTARPATQLLTGADQLAAADFARLSGLRVGVIVNQTSVLADGTHLIDALNDHPDIELSVIFAPEHGVRGVADAGELVGDTTDASTGIAIRSLYGAERSPNAADLTNLDLLIYDLQDAGTRFYTFVSTMGLAMAAAADADVEFMVLDRPNPLGGTVVSGFMRTPDQASFISQYPIPSTYAMTPGELATMIAAEGWVGERVLPPPTVVALSNWDRAPLPSTHSWVAPSPGLPTLDSTRVYPGTVLLEATTLSYGKGTTSPFAMVGAPELDAEALATELTRRQLPGVTFTATVVTPSSDIAPNPRFDGIEISAVEIAVTDIVAYRPVQTGVHLLTAIRDLTGTTSFIDRAPTFDLLAGTAELRIMLDDGATANEIIAAWEAEAAAFALRRDSYLLY